MPKVTIVIPAYNAMAYLPQTLSSTLNQTYNDFEVLIINDGSTDTIQDWFQSVKDSRVHLISQENKGLAGARNTGIHNSDSEYIAFLDADDLWEPTKLAKQVDLLDRLQKVGLVYCWVAYINETGQLTGRIFCHEDSGFVWKSLVAHNIVECGSVPLVRRNCFETLGVFDQNLGSYAEDWDMWLRIAWNYPFAVCKEPLVYYRQTPGSASRHWSAMRDSFEVVIEKAFQDKPEFQGLKARSYGEANVCLAWKCLQSCDRDLQQAQAFRRSALQHFPALRWQWEHLRLWVALTLIQKLGSEGYNQFLSIFHQIRRRLNFVVFARQSLSKSSPDRVST